MTTSSHTDDDRAAANSCLHDMAEPIHDIWGLLRTLKKSNGMVDKTFERRDADAFLAIIGAMELCSIRLMATTTPRTT